ncbi:AAA family ATPase [Acinetobacter vivianii]
MSPNQNDEISSDDIGVLRYEELSDGEQMVLGRMALFHLLQGQQDALLLLDEPETHFNDKWKREIVDIIDDAIGHTNNDILISTHSAIVLSDVFNNEIVMVQKKFRWLYRTQCR